MSVIETIPIPDDAPEEEDNFSVHVDDLYAWPDQELIFEFDYNGRMDRWIFEMRHAEFGKFFPRSVATLEYEYSAFPYMLVKFVDNTGREEYVGPHNLGDGVKLAVFPGPLGGSFHPDAGISSWEEDQILNRWWFKP